LPERSQTVRLARWIVREDFEMKPAPIGYVRATDLAHALDLLAAGDGDEKVLAGGQSLVASLNLRLIESPNLIDINFIDELAGITESGDMVRVGALTRHCELMASEVIARHVPILAEAAPLIAHAAIRTRGTIGGSLANADPAAELPACVVALDATIVLASKTGERRVKAADFFLGLFDTARRDDEILVAVEIAKIKPGERQSIRELVRRSGDYALAGLAIAGPAAASSSASATRRSSPRTLWRSSRTAVRSTTPRSLWKTTSTRRTTSTARPATRNTSRACS
jgi:aerobic carbon-monoxide dehydrogenase medium subunit